MLTINSPLVPGMSNKPIGLKINHYKFALNTVVVVFSVCVGMVSFCVCGLLCFVLCVGVRTWFHFVFCVLCVEQIFLCLQWCGE